LKNSYHHHTTIFLWPFFRDHPGEPVPEENFQTLWCKGRLTEADTQTIRLGATPSGLTSAHLHHTAIFFYGPDALPATQQTVSKHSRQLEEQLREKIAKRKNRKCVLSNADLETTDTIHHKQ